MTPLEIDALGRGSDWTGVQVVVAGFGRDGFACADNLNHLGATVVALDETARADRAEEAELLEVLGAQVRLGPGAADELPEDADLLVVTPGWHDGPLLEQARERQVPVWGEVDLAWRLRDPAHDTPWLVVAGGEASAVVVDMLASILRASTGRNEIVGASGLPVVEAVMDPEPYDALVVRLDASRLRHCGSMSAQAAIVLGDALEAGGPAADLARAYEHVQVACVYDAADPDVELLVREADVVEGARAIGCTLGMPAVGMLGLVEDILADRAFIEARHSSAAELCTVPDLPDDEPRTVASALAAAALARAHGVARSAVRDGLRGYAADHSDG
ncbi:Mur ligase family protein [Nocardioides pacificus]